MITFKGDVAYLCNNRVALIGHPFMPYNTETVGALKGRTTYDLCNCRTVNIITEHWPRKKSKGGKVSVGYSVYEPLGIGIYPDRQSAEGAIRKHFRWMM